MNRDAILALYDVEQRLNIEVPGVHKERRPRVIRYVSATGGPHFILHSQLAGADVDAVIAEEMVARHGFQLLTTAWACTWGKRP